MIAFSTTFSALAEPTRLEIIELLARAGELSSSEISVRFTSSASAISQHLKVLREARLVVMRKQAQQRMYGLDAGALDKLEEWAGHRARQWRSRLDTLDVYIQTIKENKESV